jgi:hypothetical protein
MTRAPRSSIRAPSSRVPLATVLRPQSSVLRLGIDERRLRKREGLSADLFSRLIGPPARIAIRRFSGQRGHEMEIPPAEFRCAESQSS